MSLKKRKINKVKFYSILILAAVFSVFVVSGFSSDFPWHPLQQISTNDGSGTSVDANDNGFVDDSDKVGGLSAAELMANGAGSGGKNYQYTIFIVDDDGDDCPADFTKKDIGSLAGWDNQFYTVFREHSIFIGGLYNWEWHGSDSSAVRTRTPSGWGGDVCWKTYDVTSNLPPRSTVISVDQSVDCSDFGEGFASFEINAETTSGNGYTYIVQAPYVLYMGQLNHWNLYSNNDDDISKRYYHSTHVGKTCWKVDNVS